MTEAFVEGGLAGGAKGMEGCGQQVVHAVAGEETAEVEGLVGKAVVDEPAAHAANHLHVVVDGGDDEIGELYPHAGIVHGEDGVEDGLQVASADALVDVVAERLQVDVGGIEPG